VWPLYPWYSLAGRNAAYDAQNRHIYDGLVPRVSLLVLIAVPVLFVRWRKDRRDPLVWLFFGGWAAYVLGRVADLETLGRTLPFAALGGQIAVADAIATNSEAGSRRYRDAGVAISLVGLACCAAVLPRFVPRPLLPGSVGDRDELQPVTAGYSFLGVVPWDDVVAVQGKFQAAEPAFGGKEIAPGYPAAFVDDASRRAKDNNELFSTADASQRAVILDRYHVRWILLVRSYADDPSHADVIALGKVVHRDGRMVLIRLP
jgi:hypothetical protein